MSPPRLGAILVGGLPGLLREGLLPVGAFAAGQHWWGLVGGILLSTVASVAVYALERRAGRPALLVRISLAAMVVQATVGLVARSGTVYLAQPLLVSGAWALAFIASAAIGRPLAGVLAGAWYPFPAELRASPQFRRVFATVSMAWGAYLLARTALRALALLHGSLAGFVVVLAVTGLPLTVALTAWSIHYAIRKLAHDS